MACRHRRIVLIGATAPASPPSPTGWPARST